MPLYEYECGACHHRFERIQKFSDPPVDTCPVCGGAVQKLLSSPAIQFKGSGWYITDYARAGKGDNAHKSGAHDGATASEAKKDTGDGKAESKTESKSDKSDSKAETKSTAPPKPSPPSS
jgi:putative FmdB family regulatory protein